MCIFSIVVSTFISRTTSQLLIFFICYEIVQFSLPCRSLEIISIYHSSFLMIFFNPWEFFLKSFTIPMHFWISVSGFITLPKIIKFLILEPPICKSHLRLFIMSSYILMVSLIFLICLFHCFFWGGGAFFFWICHQLNFICIVYFSMVTSVNNKL